MPFSAYQKRPAFKHHSSAMSCLTVTYSPNLASEFRTLDVLGDTLACFKNSFSFLSHSAIFLLMVEINNSFLGQKPRTRLPIPLLPTSPLSSSLKRNTGLHPQFSLSSKALRFSLKKQKKTNQKPFELASWQVLSCGFLN